VLNDQLAGSVASAGEGWPPQKAAGRARGTGPTAPRPLFWAVATYLTHILPANGNKELAPVSRPL